MWSHRYFCGPAQLTFTDGGTSREVGGLTRCGFNFYVCDDARLSGVVEWFVLLQINTVEFVICIDQKNNALAMDLA